MDLTFPNRLENRAINAAHLCPKFMKNELLEFYRIKEYFPKVILFHLFPKFEEEIKKEVKKVAKELEHPISIACEGDKIIV